MILEGEVVKGGEVEGKALVTKEPISFLGGVDPETGEISERGHELEGESIKGRILVFPHGKGSTVGSYVLYQLASNGVAPAAIINRNTEAIVAVGAIIANITLIHRLNRDPIENIKDNDYVRIQNGRIEVNEI